MSSPQNFVCVCGKKQLGTNSTNWLRHTQACKSVKSKQKCLNIKSFFNMKSINITKKHDLDTLDNSVPIPKQIAFNGK
jgi:hypothetical protein